MRVAVTGATGFIGGRIVARLVEAGHDVLAIGRRPAMVAPGAGAGTGAGARYVRWDLADPADPPPPELTGMDAVVHAAAHVADWGPPAPFDVVTVIGTARVIDACGTARLVVIGSASVYDPYRAHLGAREEEAPVTRYRNEYGRSKAAQERLVARRRPDALILRPHAVYGPGDRTLLPRLIEARRRGRLLLPGGGRRPISITHVDTVADAVIAAIARPAAHGPVNVADASPVAPRELLDAAFRAIGLPTRIVSLPTPIGWAAAGLLERAFRLMRRPDPPPLTTYAMSHLAWPFVLDVRRLEESLGIRPDRRYADELARWAIDKD